MIDQLGGIPGKWRNGGISVLGNLGASGVLGFRALGLQVLGSRSSGV